MKKRESNFELLRIIAMLMIIAHHISVHSSFQFLPNSISTNQLWIKFIQIGGKIGVNVFVLISGYFLTNSKKINVSKILKLWGQIFFYSVSIYLLFVYIGLEDFNIESFKMSVLPITYLQNWFAGTYLVMYIISPYLNLLLDKLDKKTHQNMLILMTILWCIIPTFTNQLFEGNNLIWFCYLYFIAKYIKMWKDDVTIKSSFCFTISILLIMLTFGLKIFFDLLALRIHYFREYGICFYDMQHLPILLISLFLFLGFKNLKLKYNPVINVISSATFGVYLIHDNVLIRPLLWNNIFNNAKYINSPYLIQYTIMQILTVYAACTLIELIRIYFIEKIYMKIIKKLEPKIDLIIKKLLTLKLLEKF